MEHARQSRHAVLPGVGPGGMARQQQSRVAVIGCGGLGQPAAAYLAAAGVGGLTLIDGARVSASNLQRLPQMTPADVGQPKAEALAAALRRQNPSQVINCHNQVLASGNLAALLEGHDMVVDATDNWPTRRLVAQTCRALGLPLVSGGALGTDGWAGTFLPDGPPLEAWLGQPTQTADSCESTGIAGPLVGVVGSLMALEALKLAWEQANPGQWVPLNGRVLVLDARRGTTTTRQL